MTYKQLKRNRWWKPTWRLSGIPGAVSSGYQDRSLLQDGLGRFYERVMNEYLRRDLGRRELPETMVDQTTQHLFRVGRGRWRRFRWSGHSLDS